MLQQTNSVLQNKTAQQIQEYQNELKNSIKAVTATPIVKKDVYQVNWVAWVLTACAIIFSITVASVRWIDRNAIKEATALEISKDWKEKFWIFPKTQFESQERKDGVLMKKK